MPRSTRVLTGDVWFGEGPRWRAGRLWFSDFTAHQVKSVSLAGDMRVEMQLDDQPSGLGWTPTGDLLVVSMHKRRVLRRAPDGQVAVHADLGAIATGHCNDMVVDGSGRAYVGNFGFDLDAAMAERGFEGVIAEHPTARLARIDPDGTVHVAAVDMHFPNGSVITPDGRTLIVAETLGACLTAFDIAPDGGLSGRREWAPLGPRVPDGIALDAEGAVWIADPASTGCARIAPGGEVLEVIDAGQPCYACMLGGEDGRTLFMLSAPALGAPPASEPPGRIVIATVDAPHAGLP
jgi:sugar lactone lactonase YvrE